MAIVTPHISLDLDPDNSYHAINDAVNNQKSGVQCIKLVSNSEKKQGFDWFMKQQVLE